jgi:hypothetical protein
MTRFVDLSAPITPSPAQLPDIAACGLRLVGGSAAAARAVAIIPG